MKVATLAQVFGGQTRRATDTPPWLIDLRRKLAVTLDAEMELTVQVAVCTAAKMNRTEIIKTLGCTETDVKMSMQRLQGVAEQWKG